MSRCIFDILQQFCSCTIYFAGTESHRICQDRDTLSLECSNDKVLHIVNAKYGRLVSDDGTEENCAFGGEHNNDYNCQEPRRYISWGVESFK